jgi:hypothetical protein
VIDAGSAPSSTSHAIRATSVVVLPLPAGATHRTGPGGAVAAARWSGVSRSSRCWTDGWGMGREYRDGRSTHHLLVRSCTVRQRKCYRHVHPALSWSDRLMGDRPRTAAPSPLVSRPVTVPVTWRRNR